MKLSRRRLLTGSKPNHHDDKGNEGTCTRPEFDLGSLQKLSDLKQMIGIVREQHVLYYVSDAYILSLTVDC